MKRVYARRLFKNRLKEDLKDLEFEQAYREADFSVRLCVHIAQFLEKERMSQRELAQE